LYFRKWLCCEALLKLFASFQIHEWANVPPHVYITPWGNMTTVVGVPRIVKHPNLLGRGSRVWGSPMCYIIYQQDLGEATCRLENITHYKTARPNYRMIVVVAVIT
jgi:hypothetical protein